MQPFRFKQFSVAHHRCAHKVGTDGVLLGAWVKAENPKTILDVGTGSGVIALMLAQRFPEAQITAIEMDHDSAEQAKENAASSPFAERIQIRCGDFLQHLFRDEFDLIVSNPPFFKGNTSSGKPPRDRARHEQHLPHEPFIANVCCLLSPGGTFALILPKEEGEQFIEQCSSSLFLQRQTSGKGSPTSPIKRFLLQFGKEPALLQKDSLTLRNDEGSFSQTYRELTRDFYLNF